METVRSCQAASDSARARAAAVAYAALAALYASDPDLSGACVDLTPRLRRTAEILLAGLAPSRS